MVYMNTSYVLIDEIALDSNLNELSNVESLIDKVCNTCNVINEYGTVLISVTEAFNNAVIHGNKNVSNAKVYIKVFEGECTFVFQVEDEGSGFDFNNLPDPTLPDNLEKENGRGVYLMRSLAEDVSFENNGSKVLLIFNK